MPRLVVVSRYLKSGNNKKLSNYVKYIATREGDATVKENSGTAPATEKQQELISSMLKDFPDSSLGFSYEEYKSNPTQKNASRFIDETLEHNSDIVANKKNYIGYLANRPGAVKFGSHGLFSQTDEPINLNKVAKEVANHNGNVWTHIVSLRRDDAQKMGYDNLTAWRELVKRQIPNIAKQSKIDMKNLKWYAAFHDKETNPHVHIVVYSTNEREGFLTKQGSEKIRSGFMNDIYTDELKHLYQQQTDIRDLLKNESTELMKKLMEDVSVGRSADAETIELMLKLHGQLQSAKGKKVYGYLKKDVKQTVDDIFFRLSQNKSIQKMYKLWCDMEQTKHDFYSSAKVEFPSMVDNVNFKSVKNMIIRSATEMKIDTPAIEDDFVSDNIEEDTEISFPDEYDYEPADTEESSDNYYCKWSNEYKSASKILRSKESTDNEKVDALAVMKSEADKGNVLAIHDMGKYSTDENTAQAYYAKALAGFIQVESQAQKLRPYLQYRIGKMYLYGCGTDKEPYTAFKWLEKSAMADNKYAQHTLGNMYCYGIGTEKNLSKAFDFYSKASRKGMPYSDYALAQMYYYGNGVEQNEKLAHEHYSKSLSAFLMYDKDDKLLYKIGHMYYAGLGADVDKPKSLKYLIKSAEQGNMQAKRIVAQELISGEYIPQDIQRGINMLTECADKGDTSAAYKLGKIYLKGEYLPQDYDKAEKYLSAAVTDNNRDAMYQLAKLYMTDKKYEIKKAIELFGTIADKNMWASYWLGRIYLFGEEGIAPDREKAVEWLTKSASEGNEYAEKLLNYNSGNNHMISNTIASLLADIGRFIEEDHARSRRKISMKVDKKLQRMIQKKKQELGIKSDGMDMHYEY